MTFLHPWLLLLLVLAPLVAVWRAWRRPAHLAFAPMVFLRQEAPGSAMPSRLPRSWRQRLLVLPPVLQLAGLSLMVVALARPVQSDPLPLQTKGIDILLCVDKSSSMAADDMEQRRTRLDVAKAAAAQFVASRNNDRVGLVTFARYPDLICPLTLDHDALGRLLDGVEMVVRDGPEDLTGIGAAVARAADVLARTSTGSKVVILLTDGDETVATPQAEGEITPGQAAQLCHQLGVRVYTIAAGRGHRTRTGEWIALDTSQVRRLATSTGGAFFAARDANAVRAVYARIDELEKVMFEAPRFRVRECFLPLLLVALALLAGSRALTATILRVLP